MGLKTINLIKVMSFLHSHQIFIRNKWNKACGSQYSAFHPTNLFTWHHFICLFSVLETSMSFGIVFSRYRTLAKHSSCPRLFYVNCSMQSFPLWTFWCISHHVLAFVWLIFRKTKYLYRSFVSGRLFRMYFGWKWGMGGGGSNEEDSNSQPIVFRGMHCSYKLYIQHHWL